MLGAGSGPELARLQFSCLHPPAWKAQISSSNLRRAWILPLTPPASAWGESPSPWYLEGCVGLGCGHAERLGGRGPWGQRQGLSGTEVVSGAGPRKPSSCPSRSTSHFPTSCCLLAASEGSPDLWLPAAFGGREGREDGNFIIQFPPGEVITGWLCPLPTLTHCQAAPSTLLLSQRLPTFFSPRVLGYPLRASLNPVCTSVSKPLNSPHGQEMGTERQWGEQESWPPHPPLPPSPG